MNMRDAPPPVLDSARVLLYAILDDSVRWTGRQTLIVGGKKLGPVPRLALCQNVWGEFKDIHIFHCNDQWEVLGAGGGRTLDDAKASAEIAYAGVVAKWIAMNVSEEEGRAWTMEHSTGMKCSFCDRIPAEIERLITGKSGAICNYCIAELHAKMQDNHAA
jgi:hypothetical protein